jgi:hypothetical protein
MKGVLLLSDGSGYWFQLLLSCAHKNVPPVFQFLLMRELGRAFAGNAL